MSQIPWVVADEGVAAANVLDRGGGVPHPAA
jgi:hypothetical protein